MYKIHHTAKSFYSFSLDRLIYYVKIHKCDEKGAGVRWGLGELEARQDMGRERTRNWMREIRRYSVKFVVIRWINESETIPKMEINSSDIAIMLWIYQCQASILLISNRSGPVPLANKGIIHLTHKVRDNMKKW